MDFKDRAAEFLIWFPRAHFVVHFHQFFVFGVGRNVEGCSLDTFNFRGSIFRFTGFILYSEYASVVVVVVVVLVVVIVVVAVAVVLAVVVAGVTSSCEWSSMQHHLAVGRKLVGS